jgi:hypothetical protein
MNTGLHSALVPAFAVREVRTFASPRGAAMLSVVVAAGCAFKAGDPESVELRPRGPEFTHSAVVVAWNQVWRFGTRSASTTMQSAAAAEMLVATLGTDSVSFTALSTTAPERPERPFSGLRAAATEAADSRVMCGIHFRFATDAGLQQGRALARSILGQHLRPDPHVLQRW